MAIGAGSRIGPYEVTALIGEGGMGKVWRAHHTALKRDDALKVLPEAFASDSDRLARFRREAQVLASLNHSNIAHVYGLEHANGVQALVMELVEGPTLADRIAQGPIPLDEALPIARQIAEALEAAHEQGIIHRDLKPANIKVTPDGLVKVLDFGLAKLAGPAEAGHYVRLDATASPTITSPVMMTGVGVILGTAAYMSPEQAKGREADKRSDLWAFGCVLYEMLTGTRPFDGEDVTDVTVAVLSKEPDWTALPARVPGSIRALIRRCLEKDRRKRVGDIAAALFALDEPASLGGSATVPPRRPLWRRVVTLVAAALVASAVVGTAVWLGTRPIPPRMARFPLTTASADALSINGVERDLAITPDGSRVVYVGGDGAELLIRSLDQVEPIVVARGLIRGVFIAPDGQWVGFADNQRFLKKVAITGGPPLTLTALDGGSRGATWAPEDTIIFATNNLATGLQRVLCGWGRADRGNSTQPGSGRGRSSLA